MHPKNALEIWQPVDMLGQRNEGCDLNPKAFAFSSPQSQRYNMECSFESFTSPAQGPCPYSVLGIEL